MTTGNSNAEERYTVTSNTDGSKDYTCRVCQKVFKQQRLVAQHHKSVHLKHRVRLRSCYLCDVSVPSHLRSAHMEEVHGVPRPQCLACGKKFAYQNRLLHHQRTFHMGETNFECDVCHKKFSNKPSLSSHIISHRTERPFKCTHCGKSFKSTRQLSRHARIHLNDKRYACKLCGEAFVQTASLKYHVAKRHPETI